MRNLKKWQAEEKGYNCDDCYLSVQEIHDASICDIVNGVCDHFVETEKMRIVIDIDEVDYEDFLKNYYVDLDNEIIQNGKLLPKGHGRLIDADELKRQILSSLDKKDESYLLEAEKGVFKYIDLAPTIIEAEKRE